MPNFWLHLTFLDGVSGDDMTWRFMQFFPSVLMNSSDTEQKSKITGATWWLPYETD